MSPSNCCGTVLCWRVKLVLQARCYMPVYDFCLGNDHNNLPCGCGGLAISLLTLGAAGWVVLDDVLVLGSAGRVDRVAIMVSEWGRGSYGLMVVTAACGLAQLEVVFLASRALTLYRLKLILLGLGGLGSYLIYYASEMLMVPIWRREHAFLFSVISMMATGLIVLGILRCRFKELLFDRQGSPQALLGSLTFVAVGSYLLLVGGGGAWLRRMEQPLGTNSV